MEATKVTTVEFGNDCNGGRRWCGDVTKLLYGDMEIWRLRYGDFGGVGRRDMEI